MNNAIMIELTFDDCYQSLVDFYEKAAELGGIKYTKDSCFDCRKICVTKEVQDILFLYYKEQLNLDAREIGSHFLQFGPKASLKKDADSDNPRRAFIKPGFVIG